MVYSTGGEWDSQGTTLSRVTGQGLDNHASALHLQAATKLLLAEGSKVVMVASQSSYSQGIYGLVSNLGSLVVRTIFQVSHGSAG